MKFENTEVMNFRSAIRGARNPLESWSKSDSGWGYVNDNGVIKPMFTIGENDMKLLQNLIKSSIKGGNSHSKFLRQIFVTVDITASLYYFKEFDTYKIGTTANSCSTMHKLASTPITLENFEIDDFAIPYFIDVVKNCEELRVRYNETKDKNYWRALIQLLPESWLQMRTVTLNYQVLRTMYFDRRNHKLSEWNTDFINWLKTLPYAEELIMYEDKEMTAKTQKEMKA